MGRFKKGDSINVVGCGSCFVKNIKVTSKYYIGIDEVEQRRKVPIKTKNYELASWSAMYRRIYNRKKRIFKNKSARF